MQSNQEQDFGSLLNNFSGSTPQGQTTDSQDFGSLLNAQSTPQQPKQTAPKIHSVEQFVKDVEPAAQRVAQRLNVPVESVIGQWGLETRWGKSVIPNTNNLGNIKSTDGSGVAATDNQNGSRDRYRQYDSVDSFVDDFSNLLNNKRYSGALNAKDAATYFSGLKAGGYAEAPDYVQSGVKASRMAAQFLTPRQQQQDPLDSIPDWKDVEAKPEYQAFTPTEKQQAKEAYFDRFIAPVAGADAGKLREQFLMKKERSTGQAITDTAQNLAAAALKIGPTALKGAADIANMATGDKYDFGVSDAMEKGMQSINQVVGTEEFNRQQAGFEQIMQDDTKGIGDMFTYMIDNPSILVDNAITTVGSMFLPAGAAKGAISASKALGASKQLAKKAAVAASIGTAAVQNAADTFSELKNQPLDQRYQGASVSAAMSILAGIATEGGAEGAIAKKMAGDLKSGKVGLDSVKDFLKAVFKEGAQESGEEVGNIAGESIGSREMPNLQNAAKRTAFAGTLGGIMGGGTDVLLNTTPDGRLEQNANGQPATPAEPAPVDVHPTQAAADQVVQEAVDQFGVPDHVVASELTPQQTTGKPSPTDDDVANFAESRLNDLLTKRDGTLETVIGENGPEDQEVPGVGLSNTEQAELDALFSAMGNPQALRQLYGFDQSIPSDQSQLNTQGNVPAQELGSTSQPEEGQIAPNATEPALQAAQDEENQRQTQELGTTPGASTSEPIGGSIGATEQPQPAVNPASAQNDVVNPVGNTVQQDSAVQTNDQVNLYDDIPDIGSPSNVSEAEGMRLLGSSEQEIEEATSKKPKTEKQAKEQRANGQAQKDQAAQTEQAQTQEQEAPVAGSGVEQVGEQVGAQVATPAAPKTEKQARAQKDYSDKWFGTQAKAQAFVDKQGIGASHEVAQDGKRFVIKARGEQTAPVETPVVAAPVAEKPATQTNGTLPKQLAGAKPRYGFGANQYTLTFENDVDKAAYITAGKEPSKRDADFISFVMNSTGMSEPEVIAHGQRVRDEIKSIVKPLQGTKHDKAITIPTVSSDMSAREQPTQKPATEKEANLIKAAKELGKLEIVRVGDKPKQQPVTEKEAKAQREEKVEPQQPTTPIDDAQAKAKADFEDALGDLAQILTKNTRMNIMPEDEQRLLPVLTRVMDAAFRMGYYKFKDNAKFVLDTIRSRMGDDSADQITIDHLQGAYIAMAGKYQEQGASNKREVIDVESIADLGAAEGVAEKPATEKSAKKEIDIHTPEGKFEIAQKIADHLLAQNEFKTIVEARKFISGITGVDIKPATETAKQADETIETGVVLAAREIVESGRKQGRSSEEVFDSMVKLLGRQPNLTVRNTTSIRYQAYSTPAPVAYLASELAGVTPDTKLIESTAGNGMLAIGASTKNAVINELNPKRAAMLKAMGFDVTIKNAATETLAPAKSVDAVVINPPFGATKDDNGQTIIYEVKPNYGTREVDHAIVFKTLDTMKDDGKAVLIVGGVNETDEERRREDYRGKSKRTFYYNLYNDYNVTDHFTLDGKFWQKQGASYPVDVIVIDGRGKSARDLPAAQLPQIISSYEELKGKLNGEQSSVGAAVVSTNGVDSGVSESGTDNAPTMGASTSGQGNGTGTSGKQPSASNAASVPVSGDTTNGRTPASGGVSVRGKLESTGVSERSDGKSVSNASNGKRSSTPSDRGNEPGELGGTSTVAGERVESGLNDRRGEEQETETQVAYTPHSGAASVGTLVPKAMRDAIDASLSKIEDQVGSIDQYVADNLGLDTQEVSKYFSAEQVDALALSIRNAEAGRGFIIGDQTGIGKGRVVAAMIKYALVNGKTPIFVTEKPNLYADMLRDLDDIGMTQELALDTAKPKILITNGGESIPYTLLRTENGEVTETNLTLRAPKSGAALDKIMVNMRGDDSLGDYKVIFTTYSQLQTVKGKDTERQKFVRHFGNSNYMIFDESHNAGGGGETQARTKGQRDAQKEGKSLVTGRAAFVRELVDRAFGTFFSSATYAKRPDVMDLYSSTNMKLAVNKISELGDAIKHGGVPMQQAVANMLTTDGQYIRRERTFAGVSYDTVETKVDRETAENMASAMRSILAFSRAKEGVVKDMQKELDKAGGVVKGMGEKTTVQSANFGSIMHNLIDQMLLSLKAQDSVKHAIERLKAGEKVVMTVSNTMGSFLEDYAKEMGLKSGDPVALSFKDLYMRYLDRQRVVNIKMPNGEVRQHRLTDNELGQRLTEMFAKVRDQIENAGFGSAPISPIDYLHAELQKAGYKTDEITGRSIVVNYGSGTPVLDRRTADIKQRINAIDAFNSGVADVLILNQSGSTGLSLHASSKFKDQRKRHMIIVQAEKNIDTHMQMLGRVHRTGQVIAPAYSQMMADIPAEMRPASVLMKKMASLSANTTASRKSSVTAEGVVDFMNDYGGQVVQEYVRDNPEILDALGGSKVVSLSDNSEDGTEEDIRKFTGYIPILPIKQQEEIYVDLIDRYNELIERENALGTNKLEAKAIDLDAKTLSSTQITENKGVQSVFAEPASMEQVDVKRSVRPLSSAEVQKLVDERLDGKQPDAIADDMKAGLKERASKFAQARIKQFAEAGMDEITLGRHRDSLTAIYNNTLNILNNYSIGDKIVVSDKEGYRMYGVITDIVNRASTANPAAGSSWKMHIAVANGESKTITLSFSQIGSRYILGHETTVNWYSAESKTFENMPLLNVFDQGATTRREKRWIVTGNILAGFALHPGQIITYTKDDGTTVQGVLMNRQFDFAAVQKNAPVTMRSADDAMRFLNEVSNAQLGKETQAEREIVISKNGSTFEFSAPAAKAKGGAVYLDRRLTDALGTDFYKSGKWMNARTRNEANARAALNYLIKERGEPIVALNMADKAKEMFNQPKPSRSAATTNPHDVASLTDRLRGVAGEGLFDALVATGKFKVVSAAEVAGMVGNDPTIKAFYNPTDDTTYFVADNISKHVTDDNLNGLLLHEIGVHAMTLGKDDAAFAKIKDQFSKMRRVSPAVEAAYARAEKAGTPTDEEALGYFVEANPKSSITQRLVAWIKNALRSLGLSNKWTNSLSEADIIAMATSALRRAPSDLVFDANARGEVRASKDALLAPNGKPSNLNAMQHAQVRTPEFKAWFGDWENDPANASKVVDENGEPLVVYHASNHDIAQFKTGVAGELGAGIYFSTIIEYVNLFGSAIYPAFINAKNPLILNGSAEKLAKMLDVKVSAGRKNYDEMFEEALNKLLVDKKYDAVLTDVGRTLSQGAVKDPNQIKSATGNTGAFSKTNNDIRFSKSDERESFGGITRNVKNNLIQFFGNRDGKSLKTFGLYDKTLSTQYNKALKDKPFGKVFNLVNAMQNEVSLTSIRPAELAPGILPRVDDIKTAAKVLIKGKKADSAMDKAANAFFAGTLAGENVMDGRVWTDEELHNKFGLNDTGVALYKQARAATDASIEELAASEGYAMAQGFIPKSLRAQVINNPQVAEGIILEALEKQIKTLDLAMDVAKAAGNEVQVASLGESRKAFNETITKVERIFTTARNLKLAGYAPLMRFGDFAVTVKVVDPVTGRSERDADGKPVTLFYSQFESEAEAQQALKKMNEIYANRDDVRITAGPKSKNGHEMYAGISPETIALFAEAVGVGKTMETYYRNALTERSALKRRLERKGTAGFSSDMPRVLSNFITSNGRFAAQRYYLRDLNNAIKYIPKEKGDVIDEAIALKKFIVNPNDPAAPTSSALFAWFIGGSIASAVGNLSQPILMTGPYLSQFGVKEASAALAKALPYALGKKQITENALKEGLKRASQEGIVDAQEIFHLYSVGAQGVASRLAKAESARARVNAFLTLWGSMFATAEGFNRKLTFIAAWDVAKATNKKNPYEFAVRAVNETQGIYNKVNRPNLGRTPLGRLVLTFKQYSIVYVELLWRMYKHGGPEGKRAALIMLGMLMLAAGEEGLPFAQDLDDLIDTLGQLIFKSDTNMRRNKRRVAHELLGENLGDLFLYGISSQLPIDFAGRMGMGNLIPGTSMLKPSDEQYRTRQVEEVFGAGAGMLGQIGDAFDAATESNWGKAGQNLMPTAIKNVAASVQMAGKGYATDTRGRKVVETTGLDAVGKAIGFQPTKVADETRRTAPVQQDIALQKKTEASIVDQWARGLAEGDNDMVQTAIERMTAWNESNPKTNIVINNDQLERKKRQLVTDKNTRLLKTTPREMRGTVGLDLIK